MLYLNMMIWVLYLKFHNHLTLTSVVFESKSFLYVYSNLCNLTLTSVVFEYIMIMNVQFVVVKFNFNKCCIWITVITNGGVWFGEFNFNKCCIWISFDNWRYSRRFYLTLTSVVFESSCFRFSSCWRFNLTLTSVVFEYSHEVYLFSLN